MPKPAPVAPQERVGAVDTLRGFALLGVLAINLDTEFRVTLFEQFFSTPLGGLDRAAQAFLSLAFEFKAITLFSILFGVGLAIQFDRLAANPRRTMLLVRRLLVLMGFGLIHLFLIWNGDILTEYAIAGLVVLPFLYAPTWVSAAASALLLSFYLLMGSLPLPFSFPDAAWMAQHIAQAREAYGQGSLGDVMAFRIAEVRQIATLHAYIFPRTMALMLFGVSVWRTGLMRRLHERGRALLLFAILFVLAGGLLSLETYGFIALTGRSGFSQSVISGIAPIALALGYAALLLRVSISRALWPVVSWMAPIGRMAFTNYIAQSIMLSLLFYGFGLGLLGRVGAAEGLAIAVLIYATQAWVSHRWLEHHRFGPLEWLWRTITYGERQPWRWSRQPRSAAAAVSLP